MRWEYKSVRFEVTGILNAKLDPGKLDAHLHQLGRDGWELVSMLYLGGETKSGVVGVFKRPMPAGGASAENRGECPECGYDLRGADHPVCPECGWSVRSSGS